MAAAVSTSETPPAQLTLKKKKSLRQLFIPSRSKSTRSIARKRSPTPPILASNDSGLVTAMVYPKVTPAAPLIPSVEPTSAGPSRAASSVASTGYSDRSSYSSRPATSPRQGDREGVLEPFGEGLSITQRRPSARKRASTLNFSKPYGASKEASQNPQPTRKISQRTLTKEPFEPRQSDQSFTDSSPHTNRTMQRSSATSSSVYSPAPSTRGSIREKKPERFQPLVIDYETPRESTQSIESSKSSSDDSKHGSTHTKVSSTTETSIYADYLDENKEEFTVNDVIDMYANLDDDEDPNVSDLQDQTSTRIAEAMSEPLASLPKLGPEPRIQSEPETRPTAPLSPRTIKRMLHKPPDLQAPTATHDFYGFKKASRDITVEAHDAWYGKYASQQLRRNEKWLEYLQAEGILIPSDGLTTFPLGVGPKVQRYIRKGIPPRWRGEAWFYYAGGSYFLHHYPGHYVDLVVRSQTDELSRSDRDAIERDLHRTFPDNLHFKSETSASTSNQIIETPIMAALRRVLSAFAIDHPKTGYCQSLNFIAGLLLLFLPEEKAYWMLHKITTDYLPGTHYVSLEGTDVDVWVLLVALKQSNPGIWAKLEGADYPLDRIELPPINLCLTSWFMSAFIGTLPIESVLRVWDVWFHEGSKTLFRIALAIFKAGEHQIKSVQDSSEILQLVQSLPRKMLDVGHLFDLAFSRGEVGRRWIEKKRAERREIVTKGKLLERKTSRTDTMVSRPLTSGTDMRSPVSLGLESPNSPLGRAKTWVNGSHPMMTDI